MSSLSLPQIPTRRGCPGTRIPPSAPSKKLAPTGRVPPPAPLWRTTQVGVLGLVLAVGLWRSLLLFPQMPFILPLKCQKTECFRAERKRKPVLMLRWIVSGSCKFWQQPLSPLFRSAVEVNYILGEYHSFTGNFLDRTCARQLYDGKCCLTFSSLADERVFLSISSRIIHYQVVLDSHL